MHAASVSVTYAHTQKQPIVDTVEPLIKDTPGIRTPPY